MNGMFRLTCVVAAVCVLHLYAMPCFAAGEAAPQGAATPSAAKVTTSDPEFIPLSEEKEIKKGVRWYWYALGIAVIGAIVAGIGGGGGGGGSTPASPGTVTGTW